MAKKQEPMEKEVKVVDEVVIEETTESINEVVIEETTESINEVVEVSKDKKVVSLTQKSVTFDDGTTEHFNSRILHAKYRSMIKG